MQPARLGALVGCLVPGALLALLPLSQPCRAQSVHGQPILETPQQVNDRIRELSSSSRMMPHDYIIGPGDLLNIVVFDVDVADKKGFEELMSPFLFGFRAAGE